MLWWGVFFTEYVKSRNCHSTSDHHNHSTATHIFPVPLHRPVNFQPQQHGVNKCLITSSQVIKQLQTRILIPRYTNSWRLVSLHPVSTCKNILTRIHFGGNVCHIYFLGFDQRWRPHRRASYRGFFVIRSLAYFGKGCKDTCRENCTFQQRAVDNGAVIKLCSYSLSHQLIQGFLATIITCYADKALAGQKGQAQVNSETKILIKQLEQRKLERLSKTESIN